MVKQIKVFFISLIIFLSAAGMIIPLLVMPVHADGNDWWNFRNSDTNNAVTDRPTPVSDKEAWEKWSVKPDAERSTAPTPPIIIDGKLYVGAGNRVYELDRETGSVLRVSDEMPASVGYAMNTPLYADGKIFIAIERARICAVNISDMSVAWTSDNTDLIKGQTVSPLSYVKIGEKGYVYTGTWTNADGEFICVTTDDENVQDGIKALTWKFDPMTDDRENLEANNNVAKGFYWAGAYVNENYLAIGTDNGSYIGDAVDDVPFYTLNPVTGEIIDACYNLKGPIRSTVVYSSGYLYCSTKQARIYKIPVTEEGILGEPSFIDLSEFGASSATATPAVYAGRIYLGVAGKGGQFSSDGGHAFCVVRDDAVLSQDSYLYNLSVPGYPQAGALLSNYNEDADFDGDGEADGRVYLYFTYNAKPGGIFFTYDTPDQTEPTSLSLEESKIFVPAKAKQEYCISPVIVDYDGTMYYKNDSNYLFAVEINPAALVSMSIADNDGNDIVLDSPFAAKTAEYTGKVSDTAESAVFTLEFAEGASATINGRAYKAGRKLALGEDQTVFEIVVSKNGKNRTYTVTLNRSGNSAYLTELASTNGNAAPNITTADVREITPDFDKTVTDYEFNWIEVDNKNPNGLMNIFLTKENDGASVKVWPGENCLTADNPKNIRSFYADGSIKSYNPSSTLVYKYRYPVYPADPDRDVRVSVEVTSEDGSKTVTYNLKFNRRVYVESLLLDRNEETITAGEETVLTAYLNPENATDKTVVWTSSDEAVARVESIETEDGTIMAAVTGVSEGTAVITAEGADNDAADSCTVTVLGHAHDTEWELIKTEALEPKCEEAGNIEYWTCSVCQRKFADENGLTGIAEKDITIPAKGHGLQRFEAAEAACTSPGNIEYWFCSACGKYFADENAETAIAEENTVIAPLGHDWDEWEVIQEPGCETAGMQKRVCKRDEEHIETEEIPALGHDWGAWTVVKAASCEEEGTRERVCARDDSHTETEVIPASGHDWDEGVEEIAEGCGGAVIRYTCKNDPEHTKLEAKDREGHVWGTEKTIDKEATCTVEGRMSLHCEICQAIDPESVEIIPAAHREIVRTEASDASCTEDGNIEYYTCSSCGKIFADENCTEEIGEEDTVVKAYGHDTVFSEPFEATCTENGRIGYYACSRCGKLFSDEAAQTEISEEDVLTPLKDHDFGQWTAYGSIHYRECSMCGTWEQAEHSYSGEGVCADCGKFIFDDVDTSASYFTHVKWAYSNGIVTGTGANTFSPSASCTRSQFAVMLYRLAGKPGTSGMGCPFTDIGGLSSGVQRAVIWAYNAGIITGTRETTFSPGSNITRSQIAVMLYRMAGKPDVSGMECPFTDIAGLNSGVRRAIVWAYNAGITTGSSSNKDLFSPKSDCKRYQLTIMLYRYSRKFMYSFN